MVGIPATPEREQMIKQALMSRLPEMRQQLKRLQAAVAKLLAERDRRRARPTTIRHPNKPRGSSRFFSPPWTMVKGAKWEPVGERTLWNDSWEWSYVPWISAILVLVVRGGRLVCM